MSTSTRHKAIGETHRKYMVDKFLAKQYLDKEDYEKFIGFIDILKACDQTVREVLKLGNGQKSDDS